MLLHVRDLAFGYGGRIVGSGVSFDLAAGEVLCLIGPNGGGKTTLFKTLLGLLPARGGRIVLGGTDLSRLSRSAIARMVAAVPQAHAAFFPFTVREVVVMGRASRIGPFAAPYDVHGDDDSNETMDWTAQIAPSYFNNRKVSIYGGSNEIQRNIIAKAVLGL